MEAISYLLKVNFCWVLFVVSYWLLFRKQTFFVWNRTYLIISLLIAMAVPALEFRQTAAQIIDNRLVANVIETTTQPRTTGSTMEVWPVAFFVAYFAGVLVMLALLIKALFDISRTIQTGMCVQLANCRLVIPPGRRTAAGSFSFLKWMVVSEDDYARHFDTIFAHEIVHIRQWHSLDILLVEILKVFFWFNPALWLYKRAFSEVHEFLADQEAPEKDSHAAFLISYARQRFDTNVGCGFSDKSLLKRRIQTLYQGRSPKWTRVKYLLTLPLVAVSVLLMATRTYERPSVAIMPKTAENAGRRTTERTVTTISSSRRLSEIAPATGHGGQVSRPAHATIHKENYVLQNLHSSQQTSTDSLNELNGLISKLTHALAIDDLANASDLRSELNLKIGLESTRLRKEQTEIRLRAENLKAGSNAQNSSDIVGRLRESALESTRDAYQSRRTMLENIRMQFEEVAKGLRKRLNEVSMETEKSTQEHIVADLIAEGIITSRENLTYRLHNMFLVVNGVEQPAAIHQKLKSRYLKFTWTEWVYNWDGVSGHRFTGVRFNG